jgi:uncharacterized membrane protein YbhN (UPF0104 family)
MTKGLGTALRLTVGVGAIAVLIWRIDVGRASSVLKAAEVGWLLAALGAQLGSKLCWLLRWGTLLRSSDCQLGFGNLLRFILVGLFFNNFLPSTVGGDVARGFGLTRHGVPRATAAASVIADRLIGLLALALMAVAGGILGAFFWPGDGPWVASAAFALAVAGLIAILTRPRLLDRFGRLRVIPAMIAQKAQRVLQGISFLAGHGPGVTKALIYSLALSTCSAVYHWSIGQAIGLTVPLAAYLIIVPAVMLSASLPITLNGLGIRELGFVGLLGAQGVPVATAAVFALLAFVGPLLFALLGGILFLVGEERAGSVPADERKGSV